MKEMKSWWLIEESNGGWEQTDLQTTDREKAKAALMDAWGYLTKREKERGACYWVGFGTADEDGCLDYDTITDEIRIRLIDEMSPADYRQKAEEYAELYGAPAFRDVDPDAIKGDFKKCIDDGGDGFLETLTEGELDTFVDYVAEAAEENIKRYKDEENE